MANKESKEFLILPAKLLDSIYKSLEDGKFQPLTDFTNFIDDVIAIQPAVEGFGLIDDENATMDISEREDLRSTMLSEMGNVPVDDSYDIADGVTGILSLFRIGWRKGYNKGRDALAQEIKSGKVSVSDL